MNHAGLSINSYGHMHIACTDRQHISPMLEALAPASRRAQAYIYANSRRPSAAATEASEADNASLYSVDSLQKPEPKPAKKSRRHFWSKKQS
ncbi:hypothetical protein VHEMI03486 [[Torrubiella] hemipterigena]|uniref:Uncharacterized protein n=1 Tax=[Torrubiella] hemipterigena TaxID=1531966 RepID=A0A0A1SSM4_9HYPO|nr:hypothetical protein VHEMI03486 [[Torrubiella] hemipterigena]